MNDKLGININTVRENNLALVIRLIHQAGVCTRASIAKKTGLNQATITNIVNDLIEWGLVRETGYIPGNANRRSIGVTVNSETYRTLGVRLNRDYVSVGLFDLSGHVIASREQRYQQSPNPEDVMIIMCEAIDELRAQCPDNRLLGLGVAVPGPFMHKDVKIALMSGFPGWERIDIKGILSKKYDIPVFLEHDANCGVLSELWYGDIADYSNVVFIVADIGIGAGLLINKQLYSGYSGIAGEVGHMSIDYGGPLCECGNRGCLELYCSAAALVKEYKRELLYTPKQTEWEITADNILLAAAAEDPASRKALHRVATFMGIGLVSVVNSFNPEIIILSDRFTLAGDYWLRVVDETLQKHLLPQIYEDLTVRLSVLDRDNMLGASALVLEETFKKPAEFFTEKGRGIVT